MSPFEPLKRAGCVEVVLRQLSTIGKLSGLFGTKSLGFHLQTERYGHVVLSDLSAAGDSRTASNIAGHFGLGLEHYTHFTSAQPIYRLIRVVTYWR